MNQTHRDDFQQCNSFAEFIPKGFIDENSFTENFVWQNAEFTQNHSFPGINSHLA
jgi:hypothetical protein